MVSLELHSFTCPDLFFFFARALLDVQVRRQVYSVWKSPSEHTGKTQLQSLLTAEQSWQRGWEGVSLIECRTHMSH